MVLICDRVLCFLLSAPVEKVYIHYNVISKMNHYIELHVEILLKCFEQTDYSAILINTYDTNRDRFTYLNITVNRIPQLVY